MPRGPPVGPGAMDRSARINATAGFEKRYRPAPVPAALGSGTIPANMRGSQRGPRAVPAPEGIADGSSQGGIGVPRETASRIKAPSASSHFDMARRVIMRTRRPHAA